MSYFTKNLKDNEELVRLIRRHSISFVPVAIIALVFLLLPFFLMFLLFKWVVGLIFFLILLVIGLILLIRFLVLWYYNALLITNQRVILYEQKGLFERYVTETEYSKIQDVSYLYKGLWQSILHYGTLKIQILSSDTIIKAEKIPQPMKVQEIIKNIQKNQTINHDELSEDELTLVAKKLKSKLGSDKIRKLLDDD